MVESYQPQNSTAAGTQLSFILCPSNPQQIARPINSLVPSPMWSTATTIGAFLPGTFNVARNHYAANWGGATVPYAHGPLPNTTSVAVTGADYLATQKAIFLGPMAAGEPDRHACSDLVHPDGGRARRFVADHLGRREDRRSGVDPRRLGLGRLRTSGPTQHYAGNDPKLQKAYTGSFHPGGPQSASATARCAASAPP